MLRVKREKADDGRFQVMKEDSITRARHVQQISQMSLLRAEKRDLKITMNTNDDLSRVAHEKKQTGPLVMYILATALPLPLPGVPVVK